MLHRKVVLTVVIEPQQGTPGGRYVQVCCLPRTCCVGGDRQVRGAVVLKPRRTLVSHARLTDEIFRWAFEAPGGVDAHTQICANIAVLFSFGRGVIVDRAVSTSMSMGCC